VKRGIERTALPFANSAKNNRDPLRSKSDTDFTFGARDTSIVFSLELKVICPVNLRSEDFSIVFTVDGASMEKWPEESVVVRYRVCPMETSTPFTGLAPFELSTTVPLNVMESAEENKYRQKITAETANNNDLTRIQPSPLRR
jgi:hypothetical protein